jgi:hypothetical protein
MALIARAGFGLPRIFETGKNEMIQIRMRTAPQNFSAHPIPIF